MTTDRMFLSTWEQQIEYRKVHSFGRGWNLSQREDEEETGNEAQELIDRIK